MSEIAIGGNSMVGGLTGATADSISSAIGSAGAANSPKGAEFREALNQVTKSALRNASIEPSASPENLKFSAHAVDRMKSRGISFSPNEMKNIENAVARAAQKGSRDTLVLTGDNALIVSVKNNTVVTVMDRTAMRENVFTNIDSTVMT